ncbi:MAG: hypothetical protein ACREP9_02200, partial [Candidatus Dormibacteraceae bacterium]
MPPNRTRARRQTETALVVGGFGASLTVQRGRLTVCGEIDGERQSVSYPKIRHGLARIVLVAQHGYVSLAAYRWLQGVGVGLVHLDRDGRPLTVTLPTARASDGRLRRAQAASPGRPTGIEIGRYLL